MANMEESESKELELTDNQKAVGWKRSDLDMEVDQAEVLELYYVRRLTKAEIVRKLGNRPIGYEYSWSMLGTDLAAIEGRIYNERAIEEIRRDIELQEMRLAAVEREAWAAWERSQDPATRKKVIERLTEWEEELLDGRKKKNREMITAEIEKIIVERVGEGQWLKIILDAIEKRSKLRQLYKTQVSLDIRSEHTERKLEYRVVHPGLWQDDMAAARVIEQADQRLIEQMGDDALEVLMPQVGRDE